MIAGTKGATLAREIDERGKSDGATLSAAAIERMAEVEYEARTWGGFSHEVCPTCFLALTAVGGCDCREYDPARVGRATYETCLTEPAAATAPVAYCRAHKPRKAPGGVMLCGLLPGHRANHVDIVHGGSWPNEAPVPVVDEALTARVSSVVERLRAASAR